ncbi:MAG: nucleotide exchange factor GrpE [Rhodospirillales bacterium]|jgi:molecular chaperone GrpE
MSDTENEELQPEVAADQTLPGDASGVEDSTAEAVEVEIAPPTPEERIVQLEAALADAQRKRLLALAEAENAGKRADKRISDNAKYATSNICKAILQVADNLDRALLAAPEDLRVDNDLVKNLAVGVEMTGKELSTVLENQGVKRFASLDQPFDANLHQAMQEVERTDVPSGTVVQVMQEGYMMAERLLRPAMVLIAKGGPKRGAQAETDGDPGVDTSA